MHPALKDLLVGLARIGTKAVASGVESALEDVENTLNEGVKRVKTARARAKDIGRQPPPQPRPRYNSNFDTIEDDED